MKTVILAGTDNLVFQAAGLLNPGRLKLIGYASTIEEAWNVYDEKGGIKDDIGEMPIMPIAAAIEFEPDMIITAASDEADEEKLRFTLYRSGYTGEVISMFELFNNFSFKSAAVRRLAWRLEELGVKGAAADLGCGRGDFAWQMNALMPERKLYLFDTFTGCEERDITVERKQKLSQHQVGDFALTEKEREGIADKLLGRMPYPDKVEIREGWFPDTALDIENEEFALVHIDTDLYNPTYSGIQFFYPRLAKGGVILLSGYENGKSCGVSKAVEDLELKYGAFLIVPLCDMSGTVVIIKP